MSVLDAVNNRFSARTLNKDKKICSEKIDVILNAGIKAPSGYGIEPWHFTVLSGDLSKASDACFNQPHVSNASHLIVVSTVKEEYIVNNKNYLYDKFENSGIPREKADDFLKLFDGKMNQYFREQAMFASSQMILQATELGIGTVPMGGFSPDMIADLADINPKMYEPTLVIAFGYSTIDKKQRVIRSKDQTVSFRNL